MGIAQRLVPAASIAAATFYYAVSTAHPHGMDTVLLKGLCVGLLALHAGLQGRGVDGVLLSLVMALGSAGDMVIEQSMTAGAGLFLAGNLAAVWLYRRNRRPDPAIGDFALTIVLLVAVPAIAFALPLDRTMAPATGIYALSLSAMAAAA
ncbi:MAG: lysoplasmalogenase family protein, partial [Novosphingobium sp.]